MKNIVLALFVCLMSTSAFSQYKCSNGNKVVYSDVPCASNARYVGQLQDRVDRQAAADAQRLADLDRMKRARIEGREAAHEARESYNRSRFIQAEQNAKAQADYEKQQRCLRLQQDMAYNRRGIARYQEFGWQRPLTNQEQELKNNQENYDRNCR